MSKFHATEVIDQFIKKSILRLLQIAWRFFAIALSANSAPKADNIDRTSDLRRIEIFKIIFKLKLRFPLKSQHILKKIHEQFSFENYLRLFLFEAKIFVWYAKFSEIVLILELFSQLT